MEGSFCRYLKKFGVMSIQAISVRLTFEEIENYTEEKR